MTVHEACLKQILRKGFEKTVAMSYLPTKPANIAEFHLLKHECKRPLYHTENMSGLVGLSPFGAVKPSAQTAWIGRCAYRSDSG